MLHRFPAVAIGVFVVIFVAGCESAPTHKSVMDDQVSTVNEITEVLKTIKDESSANAAKPKLQELAAELKEIQQKAKDLTPATEAQKKELKPELEAFIKASGAMMTEMMRVRMDPKLAPAVKDMDLFR